MFECSRKKLPMLLKSVNISKLIENYLQKADENCCIYEVGSNYIIFVWSSLS